MTIFHLIDGSKHQLTEDEEKELQDFYDHTVGWFSVGNKLIQASNIAYVEVIEDKPQDTPEVAAARMDRIKNVQDRGPLYVKGENVLWVA